MQFTECRRSRPIVFSWQTGSRRGSLALRDALGAVADDREHGAAADRVEQWVPLLGPAHVQWRGRPHYSRGAETRARCYQGLACRTEACEWEEEPCSGEGRVFATGAHLVIGDVAGSSACLISTESFFFSLTDRWLMQSQASFTDSWVRVFCNRTFRSQERLRQNPLIWVLTRLSQVISQS
ncbi:hypothetical protein BV25DRAFT_410770 [Artomyces pyxidatus]|uniref:Uncharacterized protein n=1 Tax=Artomyces pyxidatus TaxID=48021 RepID=A0ACB8T3N6_9AGAM|nr:hypothetical protein BV25DRAFT_410770 [Artomyces pyxidatus]